MNREGERVRKSNLPTAEERSNAGNLQHYRICVFALQNCLVIARVCNPLSPVWYEKGRTWGSEKTELVLFR